MPKYRSESHKVLVHPPLRRQAAGRPFGCMISLAATSVVDRWNVPILIGYRNAQNIIPQMKMQSILRSLSLICTTVHHQEDVIRSLLSPPPRHIK